MASTKDEQTVSRREFLATSASAALLAGVAEEVLAAPAVKKPAPKPAPAKPTPKPAVKPAPVQPAGPPINCAVMGLGAQGKEILAALSRVPGANVVAICDTYSSPVFTKRAQEAAPKASFIADYRQVLERKDVAAVFIATPTHKHKDIALAALQAGKHVYCESPMAHTIEDAKAIAQAAKAATEGGKLIFQVGQQYRANPQHHHVEKFVRTGVLANVAQGRGQWHKKMSWRRAAPTPERETELNWRLIRETSPGIVGEIGIHSLDVANWFLKKLPVSVAGFGGILQWSDGRDVPDTVQVVLEYPGDIRFVYDATLANSFDGSYEVFMGSDAAVLLRDERAWMFKETDSPLLGWEVYARKETLGDETGIALVADATKQLKEGKMPGKEKQVSDPGKTALFFSVESFLNMGRGIGEQKTPDCGPVEGYQAVVTALKANEAVLTGGKIVYQKDWFTL
jgi:predicted dehydrogenase